mgnify:CR=1 FL=1
MYYFYKREKKGCKLFILRKILYLCHTIEEGEFDRNVNKEKTINMFLDIVFYLFSSKKASSL